MVHQLGVCGGCTLANPTPAAAGRLAPGLLLASRTAGQAEPLARQSPESSCTTLHRSCLSAMGFFKKSEVKKNYELGKDLGSGNFAVVKEATKTKANPSAEIPNKVAIKVIDKAKVEDMNDIQREIEIMQMIEHPNVIKRYEI